MSASSLKLSHVYEATCHCLSQVAWGYHFETLARRLQRSLQSEECLPLWLHRDCGELIGCRNANRIRRFGQRMQRHTSKHSSPSLLNKVLTTLHFLGLEAGRQITRGAASLVESKPRPGERTQRGKATYGLPGFRPRMRRDPQCLTFASRCFSSVAGFSEKGTIGTTTTCLAEATMIRPDPQTR